MIVGPRRLRSDAKPEAALILEPGKRSRRRTRRGDSFANIVKGVALAIALAIAVAVVLELLHLVVALRVAK
jgi:hypothetical protein